MLIGAVALLLVVLLLLFVQVWRRRSERERLHARIDKLEQQATQSLLHPHFVFNAMASVQRFVNEADTMAANRYLSDFGKLIRLSMSMTSKTAISLDDELNFLELYISFERLRFEDALIFTIHIEPTVDIEETYVPVNIIRPFIENMIWYSLLPAGKRGEIQLEISKNDADVLKISLKDNGQGLLRTYGNDSNNAVTEHIEMVTRKLDVLNKKAMQPVLEIREHAAGEINPGTQISFLLPVLSK